MYKQLVDADLNTPYIGGWCEGFVEMCWKQATMHQAEDGSWYTTGVMNNATDAWEHQVANGTAHYDLPPAGLTVPVYFWLGSTTDGHVAILLSDGQVASSTMPGKNETPYIHPSLDDMINMYAQYNNGCIYRGWGETVGNIKVVGEEEMKVNKICWQELAHGILGRNGLSGRTNALDGSSDNSDYIGRELDLDLVHELFTSDEATKWRDSNDYASIPDINRRLSNPVIKEVEVIKEIPVEKEIPLGFDQYSIGDLLNEILRKMFKTK